MGVGQKIADYFVRISADASGVTQGLGEAKSSMSSLGDVSGAVLGKMGLNLGQLATAAGVAGVAVGAMVGAWKFGVMGAGLERIHDGFTTMAREAGQSADVVIAAMDRAARGTVDDEEEMLMANSAWLAGVKLNAAQLGQLMEVAFARAKAMGVSTQEAYGEAMSGIITGRALTLKRMGVQDIDEEYKKFAATINKTAEELTDAQRQMVVFNALIAQNASIVKESASANLSNAEKLAQMKVQIGEAKDSVALFMAPFVGGAAKVVADGIKSWTQAAEDWKTISSEAFKGRSAGLQSAMDEYATAKDYIAGANETLSMLNAEIEAGNDPTGQLAAQVAILRANIAGLEQQAQSATVKMYLFGQSVSTAQMASIAGAFGQVTGPGVAGRVDVRPVELPDLTTDAETYRMRQSSPMTQGYGTFAASWAMLTGPVARQNILGMGDDADELNYRWGKAADDGGARFLESLEDQKNALKGTTSAVNTAERAYADFESVMSGLMQPTAVTQEDLDLAKTGKYKEKWDEYRRRMEDVKNLGGKSPWAAKYGMTGTDEELREQAGQRIQAFKKFDFSGMDPTARKDMKTQLKAEYADYLETQKNKKAFTAELYGEVGGTAGDAAAFMGDYGATGEDTYGQMQTGIAAAAKESGIASVLATAWRDDIAKNADLLKEAGKSAGAQLVTGVLGALKEGPFIHTMAVAVAPEVAAIIARNNNRNGNL